MAKFNVFKDAKGEFRWRLVANNGKTIADSGEGYKARTDCVAGIEIVKREAPTALVEDAQTA